MSFKGDKTFNTSLGAFITITVMTIFLSYAIYKATILFQKTDMTTIANTFVLPENYTNPTIY